MNPSRRLIVNADDFGFTRDVNDGIIEAHRKGILTAATLMANGAAFDHAVALARENPALDVGAHIVLVKGESIHNPGQALPQTLPALLRGLILRQLPVYHEILAQAERIEAAGISISHLDTHKHTHLLPPVLSALMRVASEKRIRWIRRPFDLPLATGPESRSRRMLTRALPVFSRRFDRALESSQCRATDHFAGFAFTGYYQAKDVTRLLDRLPAGVTEFMTHPGRCGEELMAAATRLKARREQELVALCSAEVREAIRRNRIGLVNYRTLRS